MRAAAQRAHPQEVQPLSHRQGQAATDELYQVALALLAQSGQCGLTPVRSLLVVHGVWSPCVSRTESTLIAFPITVSYPRRVERVLDGGEDPALDREGAARDA